MTPAHEQRQTLEMIEWFPAHEPRESDPHYAIFHACRAKLKAAGKLKCWICGRDEQEAGAPIELHHAWVEQALINGVDIPKFIHLYPEFNLTDEESFFAFCEGEGNLTALCLLHHRGSLGIHSILYPGWVALRAWRQDLPVPCWREETP